MKLPPQLLSVAVYGCDAELIASDGSLLEAPPPAGLRRSQTGHGKDVPTSAEGLLITRKMEFSLVQFAANVPF